VARAESRARHGSVTPGRDSMNPHTQQANVLFLHPFRLAGMVTALPPGIYRVITEREELASMSFTGYRVVATFLQVPALGQWSGETRQLPITADDLATQLLADRAKVHLRLVTIQP
jgi:hypothetical protein